MGGMNRQCLREGELMKSPPTKYVLELYITGDTGLSKKTFADVKKIVSEDLKDDCHLKTVDVLLNPEEAERHFIVVTPTLIRKRPLPEKRIVGDLSNKEKVLTGLELWGG
jgi:circadian clock protein KaiB